MKRFLILFCLFFHALDAAPLLVKRSIRKNSAIFTLPEEFYDRFITKDFWIYYPNDINLEKLPQSIVDVPVIANVIAMVWFSGKTYEIEEMDEDFYYSLERIREIFKRYHPNTSWKGKLVPKRLVKNRVKVQTKRPSMLFTGGIDSTHTLYCHMEEKPMTLLFLLGRYFFTAGIYLHPERVVKKWGLEQAVVLSNYEVFFNKDYLDHCSIDIDIWKTRAIEGIGWMGMAAPLLYARGFDRMYISASLWSEICATPQGHSLRSIAIPMVDENIRIGGLRVEHKGFNTNAGDKAVEVREICKKNNWEIPELFVCDCTELKNCSVCPKCLRRQLTLLAVGEDSRKWGFSLDRDEVLMRCRELYSEYSTLPIAGTEIQRIAKEHYDEMEVDLQEFFDWFLQIDFWEQCGAQNRPIPKKPFTWETLADIVPPLN